jgi:hypothetical protein
VSARSFTAIEKPPAPITSERREALERSHGEGWEVKAIATVPGCRLGDVADVLREETRRQRMTVPGTFHWRRRAGGEAGAPTRRVVKRGVIAFGRILAPRECPI